MNNKEYLKSIGVAEEYFERALAHLDFYGEHKWWLSNDPGERAYYQAREEFMLMNGEQFVKDLEVLLHRKIFAYEMFFPSFKEEVERAWKAR